MNLYHLSTNPGIQYLEPQIPSNYMTKHGFENDKIARACVAPSIEDCIVAINYKKKGDVFFVYSPIGKPKLYQPTSNEVPDVDITHEIWILNRVKVKMVGKIRILDPIEKPMKYYYGKNKEYHANLYGYNYEVIEDMGIEESADTYPENIVINEEAIFDKFHKNPVFVILMHSGTLLANAIKKVTGDEFSHACISFNSKLDPMYSFGTKGKGQTGVGFCVNDPRDKFFETHKAYYHVYVMYVTDEAKLAMQTRLNFFEMNEDKLKYDFKGLFKIWFGKDTESHTMEYFCSRFVMELIQKGGIELDKVPSLWKPSDINKLENISLVNKGYNFYKYDYKITDKHLKEIQKNKYDEKNIVMQEGISSTVTKDFESKKDMNLSQFHRMNLSDAMVQQFGPQYPSVKHIRINKDTKGYCWIDDNNKLVAIINTEEKEDDTIWIQAFEIFAPYKGHGLSKQILDVAVKQFRVTNLSVNIDNEVALKIYKSYGFKKYKKTDSMIFMSINKSFDESAILESSIDYSQWKDDKELSAWMKKNIKYTNYTKLMTPDEVYESKKGSCHDQVMFELSALRKMGYKPKALFIIEYNESGDGRDNETHSLVYYEKNNKVYWFENAWGGMEGIHEFKSVQDLKDKLIQLHNSGKMGNCKKYPELEITSFKSHKPGESLQELVDICVNESAINYSNYSFIDIANYESQKYIKTIKSSIVKYIKNYDGEIIIDVNTDKLIGHVFVGKENTKDEGFILELWVDKKYRKQGLGKQLLTDAIDKYSGYDLVVDKTNTIAIKLYESFGFEIIPSENVKKGQYYMRLKESIVDEFVARKLKSYVNPTLALKRKLQAKKRKYQSAIQTPTPPKPQVNKPIKKEDTDIEKIAESASSILAKEIDSRVKFSDIYESIMLPAVVDDIFVIGRWNTSTLENKDKLNPYMESVYWSAKNRFEALNKGYTMQLNENCIIILKNNQS